MSKVHFRHLFHAAGHGTFFTGDIVPWSNTSRFSWAFDCGSRRPSHLRGLVEDYMATLSSKPELQLLCLSHFDVDHVNGLDELLSSCRVRKLVLPYIPLELRFRMACDLEGEEIAQAGALSALLVDPLAYFEGRGYGENIDEVIFVEGGGEGAEPLRGNGETGPDIDGGVQVPGLKELSASEGYVPTNGVRARICLHGNPWTMAGVYEWVFYNKQWPSQVAPASGLSLDDVIKAIREIVEKYDLCSRRVPRPGWLAALRRCYATHFGGSAKRRNEISLCVLGRPLITGTVHKCDIFRKDFLRQSIQSLRIEPGRLGVLLLGDFLLTSSEAKAMRHHFGSRWDEVGVVQIPHHGSRHSWRVGVLDDCKRAHNVICAPGSKNHPHEDVTADLADYFLADYVQGAAYAYHF